MSEQNLNMTFSPAELMLELGVSAAPSLPISALLEAKGRWSELSPEVATLMQRFIERSTALSEDEQNALFYGLLLSVQQQAHELLPLWIKLLDQDDEIDTPLDQLFGDSLTEDLASMLFILCQGQSEPLWQLLESESAGQYVKIAAITAAFAQYEAEQTTRETVVHLIDGCLARYQHRHDEGEILFLTELACLCIHYQFQGYQAEFLRLFGNNQLDADFISLTDLEAWAFPAILGLAGGAVKDQLDVIEYLQAMPNYHIAQAQPIVNAVKIGRNDPCPCGSGKKYKKCCG